MSCPLSYDLRIAELFEKHQSVQSAGFSTESYKPGLMGMQSLDAACGYSSSRLKFIHVAGTNGKGSVSSMIAASLAGSAYKVGLYTSPHLLDFRERIAVIENGCAGVSSAGSCSSLIPKEDVLEFLDTFESDLEGRSFFEITTAMAFWWFDRQGVDIAVIEVGLGGRLDSTNIITPEISIITSIGLDHCAILGNSRAEIANEKAGIFKPGVPALVACRDEETGPVFENVAAEVHCPLFFAEDFTTEDLPLDLEGPCQQMNLRTVLVALEIMGLPPQKDAISHASAITSFHGRWERLCLNPEVICDIGHNPPALKENFAKLVNAGRPLVIVYGVMADKDLDSIVPLMPSGAKYVLATPDTPRALAVNELYRRLSALRPDIDLTCASSVREGVKLALEIAERLPDALVYIGGSTFVVSEALPCFH